MRTPASSRIALAVAIFAGAALLVASCDRDPLGPEAEGAEGEPVQMQIMDAAHDQTVRHFYFLPPLTPAPDYQGTFDGTVLPHVAVEVCELVGAACGPTVARFSADGSGLSRVFSNDRLEHYLAIWETSGSNVVAGRVYRASVRVAGTELGFVDIKVVRTLSAARLVDRTQYAVALKNWPVPIRFRIEDGAVWAVGPEGGTVTAAAGIVQLTIPPDALGEATGITVDPASEVEAGADVVPGTVFEFGPDGLTFDPPAQLTITYDEARLPPELDERELNLLHLVDDRWEVVPGSVVDVLSNTVTGPIGGFSRYGVGRLKRVRLSVTENITVTDAANVLAPAIVTVVEAIQVTDAFSAMLPVSLTVSEQIAVSDLVGVVPPIQLSINEVVTVTDGAGVIAPVQIDVIEAITVSDGAGVLPPVLVDVTEAVTVSDGPDVLPPVPVDVGEAVSVSDQLTVVPSAPPLGSITLPATLNVSLGNTASLPIFLSVPAPSGGLTASVGSSDPQTVRIVTPTVSFAAGQQTANATVAGDAPGAATVQVTAAGYGAAQSDVRTLANLDILGPATLTFARTFPPTIAIRLESGGIGAAAPQGGLTLALTAADPTCVQAPSPLTIPAGQVDVQAALTYGGSATLPCTTTVTASAPNVETDVVTVTVQPTPAIVAGQAVTVGQGLQRSTQGALGTGAHGGATVTITSSDPQRLLVARDPSTPGTASTTISLGNGQTTIVYYVHGLASGGTVPVAVSAPGFTSGSVNIGLASARYEGSVPATLTTLSPDAPVLVRVGIGNATSVTEVQAVRVGGSTLTATVTNSDATVGQLVTSPLPGQTVVAQSATVEIEPGQTTSPSAIAQGGVVFDPIGAGHTTVAASIPGLAATANATRQITVSGAAITAGSPHIVGGGLQRSNQGVLGASQHGGVTVTLTSSDPSKLLLAADPNTPGGASATVSLLNGQTTIIYYMQALAGSGTVTVTASAPGFTDGTVTITLADRAVELVSVPATTTAFSPSAIILARVGVANVGGTAMAENQAVRAGGTALTATVTNSNAGVAQLVTTGTTAQSVTVLIPPGQFASASSVAQGGVAFDPVGVGQTTVAATIPNVFTLPTATRQVSVTGPTITAGTAWTVGRDLQRSNQGTLGATQHGGVTVTLTSSDPSKLLLASNDSTNGAASTTVSLANGQTTFIYYMQALASSGTVSVTASAPGFSNGTVQITLAERVLDLSGLPATTTALSANTPFTVRVGIANAGQTAMQESQAVRAGADTLTATVTNSSAGVARLVTAGITGQSVTARIPPGEFASAASVAQGGVAFDPVGVGQTTVAATIPNVVALPTASRPVDVGGPPITAGSAWTVGRDLQRSNQGTLGASQHGGVTVTLTSSDPGKLLLASSASTPGAAATTVSLANGQTTFIYYMQALASSGTVTVTASAPGFTDGTVTITLAGAVYEIANVPATTTVFAPDAVVSVRVGIANAAQTAMAEAQAVRAGAATLVATVTNGDAGVAHLVTSAGAAQSATVQIPAGQFASPPAIAQGGVAFHALAAGATTVAGTIPNLAALPTAARQVAVSIPTITAGSQLTVGGGLQRSNQGSLGAGQHGGATVTLTSSDPTKLLLTADANTPGAASTTVSLANGQTTVIYYMQALAGSGTVTVTASAPGFDDGTVFVILAEPALEISGLPASSTVAAANAPFTVRVGIANPNQTALVESQTVRAGAAALTATVTNSAAGVAQLVTSSVTGQSVTVRIQPGQFASPSTVAQGGVAFDPLATGSTTVAASIPGVLATPAGSRAVAVQP